MEPWGFQTVCLCVYMYASPFWHVLVFVVLSVVSLLWAQLALLYDEEKGKAVLVEF